MSEMAATLTARPAPRYRQRLPSLPVSPSLPAESLEPSHRKACRVDWDVSGTEDWKANNIDGAAGMSSQHMRRSGRKDVRGGKAASSASNRPRGEHTMSSIVKSIPR